MGEVRVIAEWRALTAPFEVLIDADDRSGRALGSGAERLYGTWALPEFAERPYVYANFVISRDGRISFALPGAIGGGAVSANNPYDQWLMGLLRARADAVIVGDTTLRLEPEHMWTAEAICPSEAEAFAALRAAEGRARHPLQVFASFDGAIHADAAVFAHRELRVLVATTTEGVERARGILGPRPNVSYLALGDERVDLGALLQLLMEHHGVRSLLCEGGPTLYGSFLQAGLVDDEFLTLSPVVIGNPRGIPPRPGLVEGVGFTPATAPAARLSGLRRAGDYLFLRSRYR